MKLTLSLFILFFFFGCKEMPNIPNFPTEEHWYKMDLPNQVCAEYKLIDPANMIFDYVKDRPLNEPKSPCARMFGQNPVGYKATKNWIRDTMAAVKSNLVF